MKSPSPANKSAPKARVMWDHANRLKATVVRPDYKPKWGWRIPCLVRPCHSRFQAAQLARFANLTWEEKVERVARVLWEQGHYLTHPDKFCWSDLTPMVKSASQASARAALTALGEQPGKGEGR